MCIWSDSQDRCITRKHICLLESKPLKASLKFRNLFFSFHEQSWGRHQHFCSRISVLALWDSLGLSLTVPSWSQDGYSMTSISFCVPGRKKGKTSKSMLPSLPAQAFRRLSPKALPSNLHLYLMDHNVSDGLLVSETSGECSFFSWVHYSLPLKRPGVGQ